jgi:hypothetical protein
MKKLFFCLLMLFVATFVVALVDVATMPGSRAILIAGGGGSGGGTSTITGLSLSSTTYTSSTAGTNVGTLTLAGTNNGTATYTLSGPDAARFQLSSSCTGASCSLQASGSEPDGFHDGRFLVFVTPTLAGARGSGVVYPFTVNETVTCNQTVTTGFAASNITSAIAAASAGQNICIQGSGTVASNVAVNKGVRITGVNSTSNPSITVSGQIVAFNVTANAAQIDHLTASGTIPGSPATNVCNSTLSGFVSTGTGISGFTATYNKTSSFMCDYVYGDTTTGLSGLVHKYNYSSGSGYVGVACDICVGGSNVVNNNTWKDGAPATGEVNLYPFAISGDAISVGVSFTNNIVINNTLWECYDAHGGTDIYWTSNYALACNAHGNSSALAVGPISGRNATRDRVNSNYIDAGTAGSCCDAIVDEAVSGTSLICTGGDGQGCQVENNTALVSGASCSGWILTGAAGGTLTGTQTVSGNVCTGAPATMAAPVLTTDQPSNGFVAGQANGVIGKITVAMTPAFPAWVGSWPYASGWPGTFSVGGTNSGGFVICVDGQHLCQSATGTPAGTYNDFTITGTLTGLSNSPQTSGTQTVTGT